MNHEDEKKNIEHFESPSFGAILILMIPVLGAICMIIYFVYKSRKSGKTAIKYLTSSTSPGFDLTFTPNM